MHVAALGNDQPLTRDHAQQLVELPLNRGDIRIDVRVVVFEVVEDRRARPVVNELGAFVEESRVVLIRLDDEMHA